jgi:hypothetical protein
MLLLLPLKWNYLSATWSPVLDTSSVDLSRNMYKIIDQPLVLVDFFCSVGYDADGDFFNELTKSGSRTELADRLPKIKFDGVNGDSIELFSRSGWDSLSYFVPSSK